MLKDFGIIGIFLLGGLVFAAGGLFTNWVVRPKKHLDERSEAPYECGLETRGPTWVQFRINYYLYALIFVVFDVETVLLYPWAVKFKALGLFALIEMVIFVVILLIGLWYAWKKGALEWK